MMIMQAMMQTKATRARSAGKLPASARGSQLHGAVGIVQFIPRTRDRNSHAKTAGRAVGALELHAWHALSSRA